MSGFLAFLAVAVVGFLAFSVTRDRKPFPPKPQPRTKEEARRWRDEFEGRDQ